MTREAMTQEALFDRDGDAFVPHAFARGYWTPDSMDGRACVALLGHEIERRHGGDGLVPTRLSVDMHRLARMQPCTVETRVIRDGGRLRLVEARLMIGGNEYARAVCQLLRPAPVPPGQVWPGHEPWDAPHPDQVASVPDPQRMWRAELRPIAGTIGTYGPRRVWLRSWYAIVGGEPLTPFTRVAYASDFASPWTHWSDAGIHYINTDVIAQLHRLPAGEWIGLEAILHDASQGIALGHCRIYDETGPIGSVSTTALANSRA